MNTPFTLGTDLVATSRFIEWLDYSHDKLRSLFTEAECHEFKRRKQELNQSKIPSQRKDELLCGYLASRFAAKEAFYKAFSWWLQQHGLTKHSFQLKTIAPLVGVEKTGPWQLPCLVIEKDKVEKIVGEKVPHYQSMLSFSHEQTMANAQVILVAGD
ncbi:MAG: 4'-phosphopantetheinyl transferase superfamily protein [Candidatus Dependentiae bacterium]|jgi:phosphopantetheine--protein transferase-like protein